MSAHGYNSTPPPMSQRAPAFRAQSSLTSDWLFKGASAFAALIIVVMLLIILFFCLLALLLRHRLLCGFHRRKPRILPQRGGRAQSYPQSRGERERRAGNTGRYPEI